MLARVSKFVLLTIVVELCLGGGGRFTAIGPISLRIILFGIAIALTMGMLIKGQTIEAKYWKQLAAFCTVVAVGVAVGLANGNPRNLLWEDVRPLLYFFILPFFALTIDKKEISFISRVFKEGSIFLALILFLLLWLINTHVIPFLIFYRLTLQTQELFYRGELSFFYKGFLFFGIGAIFFFFTGTKDKTLAIALLISAMILSVTRGLVFSLAVSFTIYFLYEKRNSYAVLCGLAALLILVWGNEATMSLSRWMDSSEHQTSFSQASPHLFGDRKYSDDGRMAQLNETLQAITPLSPIVGHGFGQGTTSRPIHMEIAYVEIFHKQGLVGLAFWAVLAVMIFAAFLESDKSSLSKAFALSALFVFVESATNQYFNNPIGMSVLLLSLVSLDKLKK